MSNRPRARRRSRRRQQEANYLGMLNGYDGREHPSRYSPEQIEAKIVDDAVLGLDQDNPAFLWWALVGYEIIAKARRCSADLVFTGVAAQVTARTGRRWL